MAVATSAPTPLPLASPPGARGVRAYLDESVPAESLYRLSVKQYHAMIGAGILTEVTSTPCCCRS